MHTYCWCCRGEPRHTLPWRCPSCAATGIALLCADDLRTLAAGQLIPMCDRCADQGNPFVPLALDYDHTGGFTWPPTPDGENDTPTATPSPN